MEVKQNVLHCIGFFSIKKDNFFMPNNRNFSLNRIWILKLIIESLYTNIQRNSRISWSYYIKHYDLQCRKLPKDIICVYKKIYISFIYKSWTKEIRVLFTTTNAIRTTGRIHYSKKQEMWKNSISNFNTRCSRVTILWYLSKLLLFFFKGNWVYICTNKLIDAQCLQN